MTSVNTTPFANIYTNTTPGCTDLKEYCTKLSREKGDLSRLQVGKVEFRKNKSLSGHEFMKFSVSCQGSVVGYAVMERDVGANEEENRSVLSSTMSTPPQSLRSSSVFAQFFSISQPNDFSAHDGIIVSKDKATANRRLIESDSLGTFFTSTPALDSSFAKLVVLGISINKVIPRYRLFTTNCYYFVALMLNLMVDDEIIGGKFRQSTGSRMGSNGPFRTVDKNSTEFTEVAGKVKGIFIKEWDKFTKEWKKSTRAVSE